MNIIARSKKVISRYSLKNIHTYINDNHNINLDVSICKTYLALIMKQFRFMFTASKYFTYFAIIYTVLQNNISIYYCFIMVSKSSYTKNNLEYVSFKLTLSFSYEFIAK